MEVSEVDLDVSAQLWVNTLYFYNVLSAGSNNILHFLYSFLHSVSQVLSIRSQVLSRIFQWNHTMVTMVSRLVGTAHTYWLTVNLTIEGHDVVVT